MRGFRRWLMVGVWILCLSLFGCASLTEMLSMSSLTGSWKLKKDGPGLTKITFFNDGSYEFDADGDGTIDVGGRYNILFNNQLKIQNEDGTITSDCTEAGIYKYKVSGRGLKFYLMGDQCAVRSELFRQTWVKITQ